MRRVGPGPARNPRATSSASAWTRGRPARTPSVTSGVSNACSPAYGTSRSACTPRASRTRRPAAAAYEPASASRTVLPIPGSPTTTRTADRPELAASTAAANRSRSCWRPITRHTLGRPRPRDAGDLPGATRGSVAARLGSPQPPRKEVRHEASARRRHRRPRPGAAGVTAAQAEGERALPQKSTGRRVGGDGRPGSNAGRRPAAVREHPRLQLRPRRQRDHQPGREARPASAGGARPGRRPTGRPGGSTASTPPAPSSGRRSSPSRSS